MSEVGHYWWAGFLNAALLIAQDVAKRVLLLSVESIEDEAAFIIHTETGSYRVQVTPVEKENGEPYSLGLDLEDE